MIKGFKNFLMQGDLMGAVGQFRPKFPLVGRVWVVFAVDELVFCTHWEPGYVDMYQLDLCGVSCSYYPLSHC